MKNQSTKKLVLAALFLALAYLLPFLTGQIPVQTFHELYEFGCGHIRMSR